MNLSNTASGSLWFILLILISINLCGCFKKKDDVDKDSDLSSSESRTTSQPTLQTSQKIFPKKQTVNITDTAMNDVQLLSSRVERYKEKLSPDLIKAFEKLRSGADPIAVPLQTIATMWLPSFDEPLIGEQSLSAEQGKFLPSEIMVSSESQKSIFQQIREGNIALVKTEKERRALIGIYSMLIALTQNEMTKGADLPAVQLHRHEALPTTIGDAILYQIIDEVLVITNPVIALNQAQLQSWKQMAQAKNPVYRVIALKSFASVATNVEIHTDFYRTYINETDPTITRLLIDELVTLGTSDALDTLKDAVDHEMSNDLGAYAEQAITQLEERLAAVDGH